VLAAVRMHSSFMEANPPGLCGRGELDLTSRLRGQGSRRKLRSSLRLVWYILLISDLFISASNISP